MGMFDTFGGWCKCSHCGTLNHADIQFKWLDCSLAYYEIGDYVDGHEPFRVFEKDDMVCESCQQHFTAYAIGNDGYLMGFSNEKEMEQLQSFIPIGLNHEFVTCLVNKELMEENIDEALKRLKEAYLENASQSQILIKKEMTECAKTETLMCRIPHYVRQPENRPQIGDTYYYDNRNGYYEKWTLQDERVTVIERRFQEKGQHFEYDIQLPDGIRYKGVHERNLLNQEKRDKIIKDIEEAKRRVWEYHSLSQKERNEKEERIFTWNRLSLRLHYRTLIQQMIEDGELPSDFEVRD